jgi:hypothetical protein
MTRAAVALERVDSMAAGDVPVDASACTRATASAGVILARLLSELTHPVTDTNIPIQTMLRQFIVKLSLPVP